MGTSGGRRKRTRGEVEELPSGSLRVRVYAGVDPVSGKRYFLTETIPAGHDAAKLAEQARTRAAQPGGRAPQPAEQGHGLADARQVGLRCWTSRRPPAAHT